MNNINLSMSDEESIAGKGSTERATGAGMTASPFTNVFSEKETTDVLQLHKKGKVNNIQDSKHTNLVIISYQRC